MKKLFTLLTLIFSFCSVSVFGAWTEFDRGSTDVTVTLSSAVTRTRSIIDDEYSTTGTVRYSSATIYGLINSAQSMFCISTKALTTWATQQLVAGTTEYIRPDNCLFIERVTLNIPENRLGHVVLPQETVFTLDRQVGSWTIQTSSPTAYYLRNRYIGMYPFPRYSGAELAIWYIKKPPTMDSEGDVLFDNYTQLEPYSDALAYYASYIIFIQEGQTTKAESCVQMWNQMLLLSASVLKNSPNWNPQTIGTQYNDKR